MALTAYRVLLLDIQTTGVLCNGAADVTCNVTERPEGGVVVNGCADEEFVPKGIPKQPDTILCFKFRPHEKVYTCDLKPVTIISVSSIFGQNVYRVNMYGRIREFLEEELCSLSKATMLISQMAAELSQKSLNNLESKTIDPPLPQGKVCKKISPSPDKQAAIIAIREKAEIELDKLRALKESISETTP